ncbi:MAG: Gfo/Idh/MocA family oxidoreductase [Planctomycetaceae bacterium]|jgi:predicted dehydrogenase|nr:Gfo/Idh/MocA family oxidoreductase [Planctomycetaceae bacterium]
MPNKHSVSRRRFLKQSATVLSAAGIASPVLIPRTALAQNGNVGANDRIIVGFVGTGGRAKQLMSHIPQNRAKIVAVSDLWRSKMENAVKEKKNQGEINNVDQWKLYNSDLEMFDNEKLDCAFVITQDFCRTLCAMHAILAGLDVYAEKALTTYIAEGRALVNCVRKHNKILQVGSQQRSMRLNDYGCKLVREGQLGKIKVVQAVNYPGGRHIPANLGEEPCPQDLNWNQWQGPTQYRNFHGSLLGWMQWKEYANGEMTNWGAHGIDQVQWAVGASQSGPVELFPLEEGNGKIVMNYANGVTVRLELDKGPWGGAVFRCEKGNLEINRNNLKANPEELIKDAPEADPPEGPTWIARPHIENFFDCLVSRKLPNADVEIGHRSITVCHLIGITRDLNRRLKWNPENEQFIDDDEANKLVNRPRRKGFEFPDS